MITVEEIIKFREWDYTRSKPEDGIYYIDEFVQGHNAISVLDKEGYSDVTSEYVDLPYPDRIMVNINTKEYERQFY